jgi:hypothetical protein
MVDLKAD